MIRESLINWMENIKVISGFSQLYYDLEKKLPKEWFKNSRKLQDGFHPIRTVKEHGKIIIDFHKKKHIIFQKHFLLIGHK